MTVPRRIELAEATIDVIVARSSARVADKSAVRCLQKISGVRPYKLELMSSCEWIAQNARGVVCDGCLWMDGRQVV